MACASDELFCCECVPVEVGFSQFGWWTELHSCHAHYFLTSSQALYGVGDLLHLSFFLCFRLCLHVGLFRCCDVGTILVNVRPGNNGCGQWNSAGDDCMYLSYELKVAMGWGCVAGVQP